MRILAVIVIWLLFVGGLAWYMGSRSTVPAAQVLLDTAAERYDLVLTSTFTAEADPFALDLDEGQKPAVLMVRLAEQELLRLESGLRAGEPLRLKGIDGVVIGHNEIFIQATPPVGDGGQAHALRVEVLQAGNRIAETSLWSSAGGTVSGSLVFETVKAEVDDGH